VQGDPATALERIGRSSIDDSPVELAWIDPGTPLDLVRELASRLAPGGVALCPVGEDRAASVECLRAVTPGCVTQVLGSSGLVAATRPL
jgi:hypothetical protein